MDYYVLSQQLFALYLFIAFVWALIAMFAYPYISNDPYPDERAAAVWCANLLLCPFMMCYTVYKLMKGEWTIKVNHE